MPNGKSGDHPVTDIVVHGQAAFGGRLDELIAELNAMGLWASPIAWEWLYDRYWTYRDTQRAGDAETRRVREHLELTLLEEKRRLSREGQP